MAQVHASHLPLLLLLPVGRSSQQDNLGNAALPLWPWQDGLAGHQAPEWYWESRPTAPTVVHPSGYSTSTRAVPSVVELLTKNNSNTLP